MNITLPNIKFDSADLGSLISHFNSAWEAKGEAIHRANEDSDMAKLYRRLWDLTTADVQLIAQNAFEMGVTYGRNNQEI